MRTLKCRGSAGGAIVGVIWIGVVLWFCLGGFKESKEEAALIQRGQATPGVIVRASEECDRGESSKVWYWTVAYRYQLPDGQVLEQKEEGSGRLDPELRDRIPPYPVQVVYLPDEPSISRLKMGEWAKAEVWLTRKVVKTLVFLGVFLTPGIWIVVTSIRDKSKDPDCDVPVVSQ
jgi:hypothetical protein